MIYCTKWCVTFFQGALILETFCNAPNTAKYSKHTQNICSNSTTTCFASKCRFHSYIQLVCIYCITLLVYGFLLSDFLNGNLVFLHVKGKLLIPALSSESQMSIILFFAVASTSSLFSTM